MSKKELNTVKIVGLSLISTSENRLLEFLASRISQGKKTFIVTPNPEFLVFARHHSWFRRLLNQADVAIPDGIGLVWASRFLACRPLGTLFSLPAKSLRDRGAGMRNLPPPLAGLTSRFAQKDPSRLVIKERISGTDLMERLCQKAVKQGWSVYLLGGEPGVAKKTLAVLKKRYPGLRGWAESGPKVRSRIGPKRGQAEVKKGVKRINSKRPDLLFVALGMGKQEKFIDDNWDQLNIKLAMGVGGAFDYISGKIPRAPKWVRNLGFEWLYRLLHQPWRWRRQLALLEFIFLILKKRFQSKSTS